MTMDNSPAAHCPRAATCPVSQRPIIPNKMLRVVQTKEGGEGNKMIPHSPRDHRVYRKTTFPRSDLWTWTQYNASPAANSGQSRNSGTGLKDDLIETMLRECTPTVPVLATTNSQSVMGNDRHVHSQQIYHLHHNQQQQSAHFNFSQQTSVTNTSGSRKKLGKNQSSRSSTRSPSPCSSTSVAASGAKGEMDGWKAYKLAHRTNKLIAKTRMAIEALSKDKESSKRNARFVVGDGDTEKRGSEDDQAGRHATQTNGSRNGENLSDNRISQPLTAQQVFEREVFGEDWDDFGGNDDTQAVDFTQEGIDSSKSSSEFWKIYKCCNSSKRPNSPRGRYIGRCQESSMLVLPVLDLRKSSRYDRASKSLYFDNYYFGDERAEAFGDALHVLSVPVDKFSMKNVGITGSGSSAIVDGISLRHLNHLNFSENRIGAKGTFKIFKALQDPRVNLKTLDLGNNQLGDQAVKVLVQCLFNRCTLEHLDLRQNQIYHAAKAIGELLRITTPLKSLNLSWNNIRGEPAQYLAKCMMENITLTHLNLSDNTLGNNGNADAELGACLATNKSLVHLDISNNHVRGKSVLVYVHALQQNAVLQSLVLRGNPIGSLGLEAILRSTASGCITNCQLDIGECNLDICESNQETLIYGGGSYSLNLSDRADVILLKELLLLFSKNKAEIVEVQHNGNPFTFNKKDEKALLHSIPPFGTLQLRMQPNYDRKEELISSSGFEQVVKLIQRSFGHLRDDDEAAKLFCIRVLAEEHMFTVDQANTLLALFQSHTSQVEKANAAAALIPQIQQTQVNLQSSIKEEIYDCASMETPLEFFEDKDKDGKIDVCGDICMVIGLKNLSAIEQSHVEAKVGKWISFNVNNPTGRYRLNMANPLDRRILMRILETNRFERKLRQHLKLMDITQHGSTVQPQQGGFRNVKLNRIPVVMGPSWQFPRIGVLEFDFVSLKRPYSICTALSDDPFEKFLKEFKQLPVPAEMKLVGLRYISTLYYFTCSQTQRIMEHFGTFERDTETGSLFRAEVFVILFNRIIDEWNFSETLALLDLTSKAQVLDRLGPLNCFHPLQHTETYEHLQLDMFDHRQLILVLVKLAASGEAELSNVVLNNDSVVEPDEWKGWSTDDKLPTKGVLSCAMRSTHAIQSEAQLPLTSFRRKLLQTLILKLENKAQETIS